MYKVAEKQMFRAKNKINETQTVQNRFFFFKKKKKERFVAILRNEKLFNEKKKLRNFINFRLIWPNQR